MKNEIFDNMLSRYDLTTEQQKRNAIFEVNQQVILAGLYAGGFFESAAFYGGTCLRILVYRAWKNRVKGRDWYDFEWYVRHNIPLDFAHLAERCKQFNNENITPELFKEKLIERLSSADIKQVKEDVLPFVRNPKELDIWSNDYFMQLAGMVRIE